MTTPGEAEAGTERTWSVGGGGRGGEWRHKEGGMVRDKQAGSNREKREGWGVGEAGRERRQRQKETKTKMGVGDGGWGWSERKEKRRRGRETETGRQSDTMRQTEISRQKERQTDRNWILKFKVLTTTQEHLRMSTDRQMVTEKVEKRESTDSNAVRAKSCGIRFL